MIRFQPILRARMRLRAKAAESEAQYRALLIKKLKFSIRKLRHDRFGQSSERGGLHDQLELVMQPTPVPRIGRTD